MTRGGLGTREMWRWPRKHKAGVNEIHCPQELKVNELRTGNARNRGEDQTRKGARDSLTLFLSLSLSLSLSLDLSKGPSSLMLLLLQPRSMPSHLLAHSAATGCNYPLHGFALLQLGHYSANYLFILYHLIPLKFITYRSDCAQSPGIHR